MDLTGGALFDALTFVLATLFLVAVLTVRITYYGGIKSVFFIDPLFLQKWVALVDYWIIITMTKGVCELVLASYYRGSLQSDQMTTLCLGGSSIFKSLFLSINMLCAVLTDVALRME